jgi:heat shock protein HslJ
MAAAGYKRTAPALLLGALAASCAAVTIDDRSLEGRWTVASIDGNATPPFALTFANGEVSGSFGCNTFVGPYRVDEGWLATQALAMTKMACVSATDEPLPDFERMGMAVMARPMEMRWVGSGTLTLSNDAGSIALRHVQNVLNR